MKTPTAVFLTLSTLLALIAGERSARAQPSEAAGVPPHIETWAYDDSPSRHRCNGGAGASERLVRSWLTYAETNCGTDPKALGDCHKGGVAYCTVMQYLDANLVRPGEPVIKLHGLAHEDWWLHEPGYTDASHLLRETDGAGIGYFLDQAARPVQQWFQRYLRAKFNSWDGVLMDNTAGSLAAQFWGTGYSSSEEIRTNAGLLAEHEQMARALTHSNGTPFLQVDNGITINRFVRPPFPLLNNPSSVVGLVAEGEPWDGGLQSSHYSTLLDYMAYVDSRPREFIVLLSYDRRGTLAARRLQEATVLLGYSPGHVVDWADLEQDNLDLAVWPEEGIYPTQPLESMRGPGPRACLSGKGVACSRGGHHSLEVRPGVYRREFGACYDRGGLFGRCAVIVNDRSRAVRVARSWLQQSYSHQIVMRGGDVQSGGTIDTTAAGFKAGSTTIGAHDALLLAQ